VKDVPVEQLVDLAALTEDGRPPSPSRIRAALPPGWVLADDGRTARRDGRLLFSQGWVLIVGMLAFGAAAIGLFYMTFPRGWSGVARAAVLLFVLLVIGGLVGPAVTRALNRPTRARR